MPNRYQPVLIAIFVIVGQIRFGFAQGPLPDIPLGQITVRPELYTSGIQFNDFLFLAELFPTVVEVDGATTSAPEPSTALLACLGGIFSLGFRRRRVF